MSGPPHIFLLAGESSGDRIGAAMMRRLREETGGAVSFSGIGGEAMEAEGLASIFPMRDIAVMGFVELAPHLRRVMRRLREAVDAVAEAKPDALVTIDAQVFSARLAKRTVKTSPVTALVHTVAPTVWAWKPWRARKAARYLDRMLALFPFEPPYFEREGLACDFVGHPLIERVARMDAGAGERLRSELGIAAGAPVLLVAPGSRASEVSRLLEPFGSAAERLAQARPGLSVIVPAAAGVAEIVRDAVGRWPLKVHILDSSGLEYEAAEARKFAAFSASDVALAASGTVTLELAAMRVPTIVGYRMPRVNEAILRRMIRIDTGQLVNIILGEKIIPEYWQDACNGETLSDALEALLGDGGARGRQIDGFDRALSSLGEGETPPSTRAARSVLQAIEIKRQRLATST